MNESIITVECGPTGLKIGTNLSKREYFAAAILQGIMTIPDNINCRKNAAHIAVEIANELIKALSNTGSKPEGK